jgi:AraC family transcriptional regulator of adaptative response/methylated-DNA-[protein]-cysteine methyltransferase
MSPHHLQRVFKRIMGVSPRQYADARRLGRLKSNLRKGEDVAGALYGAGYGSSSLLYEKAPGQLGMTPATYRKGGAGASMRYTIVDSALGHLLVAATDRGLSFVGFGDADAEIEADLRDEFPTAGITRDDDALGGLVGALVASLTGNTAAHDLPLDVQTTAFQRRVWEVLRTIPLGEVRTYREVAESLGQPGAARAVGNACARNPVPIVIPCHRVVRNDGALAGYRWGTGRKEALLARERHVAEDGGS